jgi:hypothetical protein
VGRLNALLHQFEAGWRRRWGKVSGAAAMSDEDRARLERQVEEMVAVAEMQGSAGWQAILRALEAEKARLAESVLVGMTVQRFAGRTGIQERGRYQEIDRMTKLADELIQRGAEAQRRLIEDDRLRTDLEQVTRV